MKTVLACVLIFSIIAPGVTAQSILPVPQEYQAEEMMKLCRGEIADLSEGSQSLICTFRLQGVGETMSQNCLSRLQGYDPSPNLSAAIMASKGAVRQAFLNYMEENPAEWGDYWANVVANALSTTFPCTE